MGFWTIRARSGLVYRKYHSDIETMIFVTSHRRTYDFYKSLYSYSVTSISKFDFILLDLRNIPLSNQSDLTWFLYHNNNHHCFSLNLQKLLKHGMYLWSCKYSWQQIQTQIRHPVAKTGALNAGPPDYKSWACRVSGNRKYKSFVLEQAKYR